MTTVYLMRHSKTLNVDNKNNKDNFQIQNEKNILSIEGEKIAKENLNSSLFDNIDAIYTSNYTRAIATAKYAAERNALSLNIQDDLGERKFGITSWNELPSDFERQQLLDENFKIGTGESQKEVRDRMYNAIMKIVKENVNQKILIVSHATAIMFLLKKWCKIDLINEELNYTFKNKNIFKGYLNYCETFKLEFDEKNNLVNIENIKLN